MTEISASLLLPLDGSDHEFGCSFVKLLRQAGGYIAPNRCGRTEPVRANCTGMTTEEIVSTFWGNSLLWIGAKLRMHGIFDVLKQRTAVFIYGRYCGEAIDECAKLFRDISIKWPVDFGCIHVFGDEEQKRYRSAANRLLDPFNRGVTERDLSTGIPNLGWITIFGGPYISRLDSSAIARVVADTWTPSGQAAPLFVQLTRDPQEPIADFDQFDRLREKARAVVGNDLFKEPGYDAKWVPEGLRLPVVKSAFADLDKLNRGKS